MAIHAGQVSVGTSPTLVYETPAGVETCLTVRVNGFNTAIGGSDLTTIYTGYSFEGVSIGGSNDAPLQVTLTGFTGSLYAVSTTSDTANYIAADIQ